MPGGSFPRAKGRTMGSNVGHSLWAARVKTARLPSSGRLPKAGLLAAFLTALLLTLGALAGGAGIASASQTDCLDYGYACTPGYNGANTAGTWAWSHYGGSWATTPNGYHNCTLYAAWRLEQNGMPDPGNWGNAADWAGHNGGGDHRPAVGAIAWWGSEVGGGFGHVAYVDAVSGTQVHVVADNFSYRAGYTDAGWIPAGSVDRFLHPHDIAPGSPPPAPLAGAPSFLSPGAISRYYNSQAGDHWVTSGSAPAAGYGFESTLGFGAVDPGPNERMLFSCLAGGDQFVSPDPGCEHQRVVGAIGEVYSQPPATGLEVVGLYRCVVNGTGDHFVTTGADCEGQHVESLLGYVTASQDRFNRYVTSTDHIDTAGAVPANATLESTLGFVLPSGGAGLRALYSCAAGGDQFTSPDPNCEGRSVVGLEGWVRVSPTGGWPETSAIYRCTANDHFVSTRADCEGQHTESLLGYLDQTHAGLDRFVNPVTGDHWITARAVPNGYQFESRLGYMLQEGGIGRRALYSCLAGGDQFTSPDPNCEGRTVIGPDGWVYTSAPPGQQVAAIYRCTVNGTGDHFVSADAGCEGQHTESLLGYIAATLAGANVPPPPSNSSPPTVLGIAAVGQTLQEGHGGWTDAPSSWSYQWTRCDASGNSCQAIPGATSADYTVGAADAAHTLRVEEWATDAGGTGGPAISSLSALISAPAPQTHAGSPGPGQHGAACVVPRLRHLKLDQARRALQRAHCQLGSIKRPRHVARHHVLRVSSQSTPAGTRHPTGYKVYITMTATRG